MSQKKVRQLAYGGLLAAVIAIATAFLKIPTEMCIRDREYDAR